MTITTYRHHLNHQDNLKSKMASEHKKSEINRALRDAQIKQRAEGTLFNNVERSTDSSANRDADNSNDNQPVSHEASLTQPKPISLHIVLVTETWAPDVNGVAMSLLQLMQQLSALGHRISLIRPAHARSVIDAREAQPKQETMPVNQQARPISKDSAEPLSTQSTQSCISHLLTVKGLPIPRYPDLQFGVPAYFSIKKTLQQWQPDVVHIATEGPLGLASLIAAKRLKIATTTGYHTQFHDFSKHFGLGLIATPLMAYFRYFHNWSQATCVPSQKTKADLIELKFKRLVEVGRGVDIIRFNPNKRCESLRESWGAGQQHTVLMMVSRLSPEKGIDIVIKAYQALQMQQLHRAIKLVIVGDGPDKARLKTMVQGSDDIIFAGSQTGEALAQHYASGDVFVFASQVETFGNVVTEAMASGLPVFAFDDAAAGMLVDDHCGSLASLNDVTGFIEMVANLPKTQQLKLAGINARNKVLGMSWQQPAQQMQAMFYQVTGHSISIELAVSNQRSASPECEAKIQVKREIRPHLESMDNNLTLTNLVHSATPVKRATQSPGNRLQSNANTLPPQVAKIIN